jgi:7-keto-8-aminopelargonate synthetase-like enzyme
MNKHWLSQLQDQLDRNQANGLLRQLRPVTAHGPHLQLADGSSRINLASNDYLGISQHPHLKKTAIDTIQQHGTGSGASRLVSGHSQTHQLAEQRFARFKHAESALFCPTGYMANLAVITSLAQKGDLICADKLSHASLLDAARASGATLRIFPHLGYDKLERLLANNTSDDTNKTSEKAVGGRSLLHNLEDRPARKFILSDSVFSMDGDAADLPRLCDIAEKHNAILIVDEAHGTGVLGKTGSGLCEAQGVSDRVDIVVSTASKALGSLGGMVSGSSVMIQTLVNKARPFIYTTGSAAMQPAVVSAALDVIETQPQRRHRVLELAAQLRKALSMADEHVVTPIVPIVAGSAHAALSLARHLDDAGFYAPAIRPPTVAPGSARVRISLRADLEEKHMTQLIDAIRNAPEGD